MEWFSYFVQSLDITLSSRRKRHIVGGVLLSISALFGGLAVTTMTLSSKTEEDEDVEE